MAIKLLPNLETQKRIADAIEEVANKLADAGAGADDNYIKINHADLVELRDTSQLRPGALYQIIDYDFTTTQDFTKSAKHHFDIIVMAISENTLSESAMATHSERDIDEQAREVTVEFDVIYADSINGHGKFSENAYRELIGNLQFEPDSWGNMNAPILSVYINDVQVEIGADIYFSSNSGYLTFASSGSYDLDEIAVDGSFISAGYNIQLGDKWRFTIAVPEKKAQFTHAKLEAWEIKYCLDNDITRFLWADEVSGKGVIYHMKDEHDNECAYDFKNAMFIRYAISQAHEYQDWLVNREINEEFAGNDDQGSNFIYYMSPGAIHNLSDLTVNTDKFKWMYTFGYYKEARVDISIIPIDGSYYDGSTIKFIDDQFYGGGSQNVLSGNKIKPYKTFIVFDDKQYGVLALNDNVFTGNILSNDDGSAVGPKLPKNNTLHENTYSNSFAFIMDCELGANTDSTFIGPSCERIVLGVSNDSITIGSYCDNITVGNNSQSIMIGTGNNNIRIGHNNTYHIIGYSNYGITMGDDCEGNSIGSSNDRITFGYKCSHNKLHNGNEGIIFEHHIGTNYGSSSYLDWGSNGAGYIVRSFVQANSIGLTTIIIPDQAKHSGSRKPTSSVEFRKISNNMIMWSCYEDNSGDLVHGVQTV